MTMPKFTVVSAAIVCLTGSLPITAKAQMNLGGYCFSCAYNPMYPHLEKPSSTENSYQVSPNSSSSDLSDSQCTLELEKVTARYNERGYDIFNDNNLAPAVREAWAKEMGAVSRRCS
jgi:hypothetical protein